MLSNLLLNKGFTKGKVDTTLFTKHIHKNILIVQIYVDDIIFGFTNNDLCKDFKSCMKEEFEMSMMANLTTFLDCKLSKRRMGSS